MTNPNTNKLDTELLTILADYADDLANLKKRDGLLPADAATQRLEALLSAAEKSAMLRQRAYDEKLITAAKIEELKRAANHNNSEYTSDYLEERIKELEKQ